MVLKNFTETYFAPTKEKVKLIDYLNYNKREKILVNLKYLVFFSSLCWYLKMFQYVENVKIITLIKDGNQTFFSRDEEKTKNVPPQKKFRKVSIPLSSC